MLPNISTNQSGAAEAWWAHNPQVPGSKPGSDTKELLRLPNLFVQNSKPKRPTSQTKAFIFFLFNQSLF